MNKKSKEKKHDTLRTLIQAISATLCNGYVFGFFKGKIFQGDSKAICLPVLNCYSCPGAVGSCPIGALQAVVGSPKYQFSFYVIGIITLFGILLGRLICGFLCPFGWIQDLLYKIPTRKIKVPLKIDKPLRYLKYIVLFLTITLPIFIVNAYGMADPFFCKWICPAGTLEGGIPLLFMNEQLQKMIGFLFHWKFLLLISILLACIFISRFFCKYLCPLGAFYGLLNRFSIYQIQLNQTKCTGCKKCNTVCPVTIDVTQKINSAECIRCGKCKASCSNQAISSYFGLKK